MLGIFLIYFVGKKFADLAEIYEKSKWGYGILGVASYYMGTFLAVMAYIIYLELFTDQFFEDANETAINLLSIPFGILACWGTYKLLEANWKKNKKIKSDHYKVLDDDFLT